MKLDSVLTIDLAEMSRKEWSRLLSKLTFTDNDEVEIQAYDAQTGTSTFKIPRGVIDSIPDHVARNDFRSRPKLPTIPFLQTLDAKGYGGQADAVEEMLKQQQGIIVIPPGGGKTSVALAFACRCETSTLVIVHTKDLFDQWVLRAQEACPEMSIGMISGSTCTTGHLTVAMAQSLKKHLRKGGKFWRKFGCLIIDETHHAAAETWQWILNACPAYYRFGFTATETRADGRHPLVQFLIGPVIVKVKFKAQVPLSVQPVRTGFGHGKSVYAGPRDYTRMLARLSKDEERNALIAGHVHTEAMAGRTCLVLSRQIKHLEHMATALYALADGRYEMEVLTSAVTQRDRYAALESLRDGSLRVMFATQLADEGLDVARLDRLFLTFPGKHDGKIIQQVGRIIRTHDDKTSALCYDYVDDLVTPLARHYVERRAAYRQLGITTKEAIGYGTKERKPKRKVKPGQFKVWRPSRPA